MGGSGHRPGRLALAHTSDEHITLDDLVAGVTILAAAELLGVREYMWRRQRHRRGRRVPFEGA